MHGPPGSGKTALAASIAMSSEFAFVKLISPEAMVGYNEPAKIQYISKVFNDSYKSPNSLIVVDNIERLLGIYRWHSLLILRLDCSRRSLLECNPPDPTGTVPETSPKGTSPSYHRDNLREVGATTDGCDQFF